MKMYVARDVCNTSLRLFFDRKPELRDEFYENFKKEIEICKELL